MKFLGAHVSTAGGLDQAPLNAMEIGAKAFALFVKPQRQWVAPPLSEEAIASFKKNLSASGIVPEKVLPHASYLINMASPDDAARAKSLESLKGEMRRCAELGLPWLNIHPGSIVGVGTREEGVIRIADTVNKALAEVPDVTIVLENTAGQGSYLGSAFEELEGVLDRVKEIDRMGVCLDTAHLYGAGFDLSTDEGFAAALSEFDRVIGFKMLRGMHLNDTKVKLASRTDRHAPIGEGVLGWETFGRIMKDDRFDDIPMVLETPDPSKWAEEIRRMYTL